MTAPFKVINVIDNGNIVSEWMAPLEDLLGQISSGSDRLAANYSLENMKLHQHLSFDILVNQDDKIISFAGVFNGGRYPEGVYRVLNRTWVHEDYRVKHGAFAYLTSQYILPEQFERLRKKLKLVFVSRERLSGKGFLQKWIQHQPESDQWTLSENLVQVVPGVEKKSCYQYICSRTFADVQWSPQTRTPHEWSNLAD